MEKRVRAFKTHAEAEAADLEHMRSLTPEQSISMMLEIVSRSYDDPPQRLQRVYRLVKWDER